MKKSESRGKKWAREIAEIILAFAVAWLGYQALSLATGTSMPIVAVVSDSMYHTNSFGEWWEARGEFYVSSGITKERFDEFPFRNGLSRGDLLFVINEQPRTGDVVIYDKNGKTIVHRVVQFTDGEYITKGDNNFGPDQPVSKNQIKGKVLFGVPLLGYPRFILFAFGV